MSQQDRENFRRLMQTVARVRKARAMNQQTKTTEKQPKEKSNG